MIPVQSIRLLFARVIPTLAACALLGPMVFTAPAALAASATTGRQPLVLDTQSGISDGQSGTVLQTAPLSHAPIVQAKSMASASGLDANSQTPITVSPHIGSGRGGKQSAQSSTQPSRPMPQSVSHPSTAVVQ
jgi:hypothetical protein